MMSCLQIVVCNFVQSTHFSADFLPREFRLIDSLAECYRENKKNTAKIAKMWLTFGYQQVQEQAT